MTFSFDASLSTDRDKVRFFIGDTVDSGHLVENETIATLLTVQPNPVRVAITIARSLAATFARKADKQIGKTRIDSSKIAESFLAIAETLEAMGDVDGAGMTAAPLRTGGISESLRDDLRFGDDDRIQPPFSIGQDDHPHAPVPTRDETED